MPTKTYTVRTSCEVAGVWREAGAEIELTAEQARELAPPYGAVVSLVTVATKPKTDALKVKEPANGGLDGRKRRNRRAPKRLATRPAIDSEDTDDAAGQSGDAPGLWVEAS